MVITVPRARARVVARRDRITAIAGRRSGFTGAYPVVAERPAQDTWAVGGRRRLV